MPITGYRNLLKVASYQVGLYGAFFGVKFKAYILHGELYLELLSI